MIRNNLEKDMAIKGNEKTWHHHVLLKAVPKDLIALIWNLLKYSTTQIEQN
jgi:hypothetical protein